MCVWVGGCVAAWAGVGWRFADSSTRQARKAQTIEKREVDKKLLRLEIQKLLQEAALIDGKERWADTRASGWKDRVQHAYDLEAHELDALQLLVDQAASEHDFVQVVHACLFLVFRHLCLQRAARARCFCNRNPPKCPAPPQLCHLVAGSQSLPGCLLHPDYSFPVPHYGLLAESLLRMQAVRTIRREVACSSIRDLAMSSSQRHRFLCLLHVTARAHRGHMQCIGRQSLLCTIEQTREHTLWHR